MRAQVSNGPSWAGSGTIPCSPAKSEVSHLTPALTVSVHVSGCPMVRKNKPLPYEPLGIISRSFDQILLELEKLEELDCFRQHAPLESAQLAVQEVRSWTLSEILEVLHEREEGEWMRLGRLRVAREKRLEKRADTRMPRNQRKRGRKSKR
jgi:hypothetical protein